MCCLPTRQLTNDHEPACMCHCIVFGINPRVNVYLTKHRVHINRATVTFRGGRVIFEREQGPPWQDVLTQMLEEQNSILGDN